MLLVIIFFLIIIIMIIAIINMQLKLYIIINKERLNLFFKVYIFKKIQIAKIQLNRQKKKKRKNKKINKFLQDRKAFLKFIYEFIKKRKLKLEKLNLKIDICTTDPILTSYLVMIISNIVTIILKKTKLELDYKNCKYVINPIYLDKKILNIKLNCIISSNIVHIIYIFYRNFRKWRCDVYERRTSNRKPYGNSNE